MIFTLHSKTIFFTMLLIQLLTVVHVATLQKIHEKFETGKSAYCLSLEKGRRYYKISFYFKYIHTFNELVIKNTHVQKMRPLFVFMEWLHLLHR